MKEKLYIVLSGSEFAEDLLEPHTKKQKEIIWN